MLYMQVEIYSIHRIIHLTGNLKDFKQIQLSNSLYVVLYIAGGITLEYTSTVTQGLCLSDHFHSRKSYLY
jgi:hypothetical protein